MSAGDGVWVVRFRCTGNYATNASNESRQSAAKRFRTHRDAWRHIIIEGLHDCRPVRLKPRPKPVEARVTSAVWLRGSPTTLSVDIESSHTLRVGDRVIIRKVSP